MYRRTTATKKIQALSKRLRAVQGGTSASKTISILLCLINKAQQDKTPTLTSVVSETFPHLRRGAIKDFLSIMEEHGYFVPDLWNKTDYTYTFETGSKIEFFSADQSDKVRGPRRDRLFINEANNVSFETFEQLEVRTKDFIFLDWNPTNEFWFYTEVLTFRKKDLDHIILTYKDNEALDQAIIDSIESRQSRKGWWQVYGLGLLGEVEGKIFKDWDILEEVPHYARLERYGLDFGYSNDPTCIVAIYYANGAYIIQEIAYTKGLSNKQIADILNNQPPALVVADSAEPKSIDEIRLHGVNIVGIEKTRGETKTDTWTKWSIDLVQNERLSMTKTSPNVIREYRNYLWETDKDGMILNVPEHTFSHSMDAIRYALVSIKKQPKFVMPKETETLTPWYGDRDIAF